MDELIRFEWNHRKNSLNRIKHGIEFEEAKTVFYDEYAVEYYDPEHSDEEDRFLSLGLSQRLRVLVLSYCFRTDDSVIRIISARKANPSEAQEYWRLRNER